MSAYAAEFLKMLVPVSDLRLPPDQYLIWGSGPLAMRGLRAAADVDLVVRKVLWDRLVQTYGADGPTKNRIKLGNVEIWKNLTNLTDRIDEIISDAEIIEGFPFMKLRYTLEWKRFRNSSKDVNDMRLIKEWQTGAYPGSIL